MIRVHKSAVIFFFVLLLSMRWEINDYLGNNITQQVETVARVLSTISIVLLLLQKVKAQRMNHLSRQKTDFPVIFFLLILMHIWLLLSTLIHHGDMGSLILGDFLPLVVVGLLFESVLSMPESIIHGGMLLSEFLIYCNLLAVLLFPDGMYSTYHMNGVWFTTKNWLLGNKNLFFPYLLFGCVSAYIYSSHGGKKWREWGVYIASFLSVVIAKSSTSILAMLLLIILFFILRTKRVRFNVYLLTGINIVLFFLIVIFRTQNIFSLIIEDGFGKSLTFSGRTGLWDAIWPLIWKNPILGLGSMKSGVPQKLTGFSFGQQAHNLIIGYLYEGGIVCLGLYLVVMALVYHKLHKFQNTNVGQCLIVALFVFQITGLMEAHRGFKAIFIYLIYFIAYNVDRFLPQGESEFVSPKQRRSRLDKSDRTD